MIHKLACFFQIRRDAETDLLFKDRIRMCQKGGCSGKSFFLDQRYYLAGCTLCKTHYSM